MSKTKTKQEMEQHAPGLPPPTNGNHALEVFAGSGRLAARLRDEGIAVETIDLNRNAAHDMSDPVMPQVLLRKALGRRSKYSHFAPPCNSYSPAVWPQLRSKAEPEGLQSLSPAKKVVIQYSIAPRIPLALERRKFAMGAFFEIC